MGRVCAVMENLSSISVCHKVSGPSCGAIFTLADADLEAVCPMLRVF